ncbi:MAG: LTA synthase family protein [Succinivibrio sp.]
MNSISNKLRNLCCRGINPVLVAIVISFTVFTLFRVGLCIWQYKIAEGNLINIFYWGLRYDLSICCTMYAAVLLIALVFNFFSSTPVFVKKILTVLISLILTVQILTEVTTFPFIEEYGVRPNELYIEYLIYPKEVVSMLANGHLLEAFVSIFISLLAAYGFYKLFDRIYRKQQNTKIIPAVLLFVTVTAIVPVGLRGTLGHKPLNPSNAAFSESPLLNTIPINSAFNIFYALRHFGENDVKSSQIYAFADAVTVLESLEKLSSIKKSGHNDLSCPINQKITPAIIPDKKRNVVVILMESFGARYVESLGGDPIAPNLEKLKNEGWWFERMYATGHRSVRGIEAVTASYVPGPLPSQVKLNHKRPFTTISEIYQQLGYDTSFIYGGESHFDNMRSFFFNNGVNKIIEQKDYKTPKYVASWGVSDEDLFEKANAYFKEKNNTDTPFCSVVFTSSFHDPFDIPDGKVNIDGVKTGDPKRLTAAKYADYALGRFFEMAKKEEYYSNTVFLIIADHDSRVKGIDAFPLTNFSIPALIISPDLKPKKDNRIVSQIDMLPTLLSVTGVSGDLPLVGQDLMQQNITERAPLAYNEIFGYIDGKDNTLTLMMPGFKPALYNIKKGNSIKALNTDYSTDPQTNMQNFPDLKYKIGILNLGITIYENDYQRADCIKNLKQL